MKKYLYIVTLVFVFPLVGVGQNDSINADKGKPIIKNQIDLDVQFLGIDFLYKHKIGDKYFVGGGIGLGGFANFASNGTYAEFIRTKVLFDYSFSQNFHIYQASTFSLITYDSESDNLSPTLKLGIGVFHRISKIEIGIEPSLILSRERTGQLVTSLLIIKIPLKRWRLINN